MVYDTACSHSTYRFTGCNVVLRVQNKFRIKMPNFVHITQGQCSSRLTIAVAGWLLHHQGISPREGREPTDLHWFLCITSEPSLPDQLATTLVESVSLGVGFSGKSSGLTEFTGVLVKCVKDLDALYLVDWVNWL